jgi:hypothetical protein
MSTETPDLREQHRIVARTIFFRTLAKTACELDDSMAELRADAERAVGVGIDDATGIQLMVMADLLKRRADARLRMRYFGGESL